MTKTKKKLPDNQISVYQTPDGSINIEVLYANENIWLSQKRMAQLFGCTADNISLHLKNIYQERELDPLATAEEFSVVQKEGNREVARTTVQNKLHFAITGKTSAEIVVQRADSSKPHLGLTSWRKGPQGKIPVSVHFSP